MVLRTKLEASTIQLEETSRKMNAMCEILREERDSLQRYYFNEKANISKYPSTINLNVSLY